MTIRVDFILWKDGSIAGTANCNWLHVPRVGDYVEFYPIRARVRDITWTNDLIRVNCDWVSFI